MMTKRTTLAMLLMLWATWVIKAQEAVPVGEPVQADSTCAVVAEPEADATQAIAETVAEAPVLTSDDDSKDSPTLTLQTYEPPKAPDFNFIKSRTNPATKPYTFWQDQTWVGIPIFFAGMIAKNEKVGFQQNYKNPNTRIRLIKYNFHNEIDNYTQYVPLALTIGLKIGGVESRSDWPRFWASSAASAAIMAGMVNGIKYTASEMRPDGSTRNSWPSGHTATESMAATILHKEYGLTRSPWYSVGAYTLATATGVMRVLNNRHWISDVLSGAGIGIMSVELGYGLMDLLFKGRGLMRNDMAYYPDLRKNPSFFSISMGVGLGNKNLELPPFNFDIPDDLLDEEDISDDDTDEPEPLKLKFRSATVVGAEGAYFFNPYIGVGGRLRVKATPINGWSKFALSEEEDIQKFFKDPLLEQSIQNIGLMIESDHLTEFAADAGVYFSLPLSSRFALGSKVLVGRSVMTDIEIKASYAGDQYDFNLAYLDDETQPMFTPNGQMAAHEWNYINIGATNSMKFGTGISLTYAHKNSFSWRVFCDYDYARKTFTATYNPLEIFTALSPDAVTLMSIGGWEMTRPAVSSTKKSLHQWVLGGAFCISF